METYYQKNKEKLSEYHRNYMKKQRDNKRIILLLKKREDERSA